MEVTLFRHGIAVDRADPRCPVDFDRPLTVEGKQRATVAIRGLKAVGVKPDRVLASPFLRCVQTARLILGELGLPRRALTTHDEFAPGADPAASWELLRGLAPGSVIVVGHGGTLEPMAGHALGIPAPESPAAPDGGLGTPLPVDIAFRALHLKKAGALQLDVRHEPALEARIVWHLPARLLRQLARP
jgi:phosphohistidine phosphatase SixA